jgi:hypothetical protein
MVLKTLAPAYAACGFGDPWDYHSVYGDKARTKCNIMSNSRFGIGDVTMLAVATGRCEYVEDITKRMTHHCLHMTSDGRKLEDVTVIIKALGLIADFEADRFHKIKEMKGPYIGDDNRRYIYADPLGMNAANFASFSTGPGSYLTSKSILYFMDWPSEFQNLIATGVLDMLPKMKATEEKPAHQYDAKYITTAGMMVEGATPRYAMSNADVMTYQAEMVLACAPLDKFMKDCRESWDQYQLDWWRHGHDFDYVPYPYTDEMVEGFFQDYDKTVGPRSPEKYREFQKYQEDMAVQGPTRWEMPGAAEYWYAQNVWS